MSDIAIEFYKILYGKVIENFEMLDSSGYLIDKEFAGDTMNSYNTLKNRILKTDYSSNDAIKLILSNYENQYHCLANFWVIPMRHGRTSRKKNSYDSLDLYIKYLRSHWSELKLERAITYGKGDAQRYYKNYFTYDYFDSLDNFCKIQFVQESDDKAAGKYANKMYIEIIGDNIQTMHERARLISNNDDICYQLFQLFERHNLLI